MENHSYDNMLGWLEHPIGDLTGEEFNYLDPNNTSSKKYFAQKNASYQTTPDPPHLFPNVNNQLYGTKHYPIDNSSIPDNQGFAHVYSKVDGDPQNVMNCYEERQVPVISALARNFKVMNRWFSSVPGPTDPNKMFFHAATSLGNTEPCLDWYCNGYPIHVKTIYENLDSEGFSNKIHYMDWNEAWALYPLNQNNSKYIVDQNFNKFFQSLRNNSLNNYTFLIPRGFQDSFTMHANTQHPSQDVRNGELLIKEVYEKLRASPYWQNTLLLITYDEHGGFWDSITPPGNVVNPNPEVQSYPDKFNFTRLGVRVPAIAISPWLQKGVDSTQYEHASVPATIKEIFNLKSDYLTLRDKNANKFISEDELLDEIRTDCPMTLPNPPSFEIEPRKMPLQNTIDNTAKTQVYLLGSMLLKKKIINESQLQQQVLLIENDTRAYIFIKWASKMLGFQENDAVYLNEGFYEHQLYNLQLQVDN